MRLIVLTPIITGHILMLSCNGKPVQNQTINSESNTQDFTSEIDSIVANNLTDEREDGDNFFDDWEKQPFKGTMSLDSRIDEDKLKEILSGNDPSPDAQFKFDGYRFIIYDYGLEQTRIYYDNLDRYDKQFAGENTGFTMVVRDFNDYDIIPDGKSDTLKLYENVFEDLSYKLIQIIPDNPTNHFVVSICTTMNITEQYNWKNPKHREDNWWENEAIKWSSFSTYRQLSDSARFFYRTPNIYEIYTDDFTKIYKELNLRDTLVDLSGESENIATLVYKNVPATFYIYDGIIRIRRFNATNQLLNTQYIKITFSYGC